MKVCQHAAAAFGLLLPLVLQAAAGAGHYASYLQRIPATPRSVAEAYAKVTVKEDGRKAEYVYTDLEALQRTLNQEIALAASEQPDAMPGAAQMGDPESAARLAQQMEGMSDAQKMAMAMQMAQGMNAAMPQRQGGTEWTPAEQEFSQLLHEHAPADSRVRSSELEVELLKLTSAW